MWMPNWLYERLPWVYLLAALACFGMLERSPISITSALLFVVAAGMVHGRRRSARNAAPRSRLERPHRR